jgi:hypothetical protein
MQRPLNSVLATPDRVYQCDRLAFVGIVLLLAPTVAVGMLLFQLNPLWFVPFGGLAYLFGVSATFIDPFWFRRWMMLAVTFGHPIRRTYGGW